MFKPQVNMIIKRIACTVLLEKILGAGGRGPGAGGRIVGPGAGETYYPFKSNMFDLKLEILNLQ